ncbi:MAG: Crp/Fnr family transcriptional regulator [Treponema sp.]|jgi:CRP/FNR family transcriptional regulator|nr:Crp/Fnr family transcriptional regulator [Treponema sp.]
MLNNHKLLISKEKDKGMEVSSRLVHLPCGTASLEQMGFLKELPKGEVFIESGQVSKYCYVIKKGGVIGFEYSSGGDERIYDIMLPGSLMLDACLLMNKPSPVYFKTLRPTELICIDRHTLLDQMSDDFNLVMNIIESISYKFFSAMDMVRETGCHDANWRFCNLLLMFADKYGVPYDGKIMIAEKVSQQMFSDLLGVNRITVNRIIKKLRDMGLILQVNGLYCISDMEKLRKHMDYIEAE